MKWKTGIVLIILLSAAGCSPKIYRPPALGAEYQLDRGMPSAKKPSHLFDRRMERKMREKGMLPEKKSPPATPVTTKTTETQPDSAKVATPAAPKIRDSAAEKPAIVPESQE